MPNSQKLAFRLVMGAVVCAMLIHFWVFVVWAAGNVNYPFELDYGEGIVWQQAMLIPGPAMYGDITRYPFIVFHYPPFYHLVVRALDAAGLDALSAGRGVSLLSTLVSGALIGFISFRAARPHTDMRTALFGGLVGGLSYFCFAPVAVWSSMFRVDMLAMALTLSGLSLMVRTSPARGLDYLAMSLFVLAAFTKQTFIAAPAASFVFMTLNCRRHGLRVGFFGVALGLCGLGVAELATSGGFLKHILLYNINRYDIHAVYRELRGQEGHAGFLLLAVTGCLVFACRAVRNARQRPSLHTPMPEFADFRSLTLIVFYFGFALSILLATLGKSGGGFNYFIEANAAVCILVGFTAAQTTGVAFSGENAASSWLRTLSKLCLPLVLLAQVLNIPVVSSQVDGAPERTRQMGDLLERIRRAPGPVLSEDMVLLMKAGKPIPWEPAVFAELSSTGAWDERLITDMIAAHRFSFIVTSPLHGLLPNRRYPPGVIDAIDAAYPQMEAVAGKIIHLPPSVP